MHTCHHCCCETNEIEIIDEAGGAELCERCASAFWTAFMRAEDAMDGDR